MQKENSGTAEDKNHLFSVKDMSELKGIEQTETDPEVLISVFLKDFSDVYNEEDEK